MKRQLAVGVLAMIGSVALSATMAHAGAGGTPSPLTSFFVCQGINGDDPGQIVDIESPIFGNRLRVRIGNGVLACAFAKLFGAGTTTEISPNPSLSHEQLKCYTVSVPRGSGPPTQFNVTDELLGEEQGVTSSRIQYVCAPASLTQ